MTRRADGEYRSNMQLKRGIVVDRDPKKKRAKVKFDDEDEVVSFWVDVTARAAGKSKLFIMPELEDEVWCALDMKGEDGCIIGSKYNEKDTPPYEGNDDVAFVFPGGSIHLDRASGALTIVCNGDFDMVAASGHFR